MLCCLKYICVQYMNQYISILIVMYGSWLLLLIHRCSSKRTYANMDICTISTRTRVKKESLLFPFVCFFFVTRSKLLGYQIFYMYIFHVSVSNLFENIVCIMFQWTTELLLVNKVNKTKSGINSWIHNCKIIQTKIERKI